MPIIELWHARYLSYVDEVDYGIFILVYINCQSTKVSFIHIEFMYSPLRRLKMEHECQNLKD